MAPRRKAASLGHRMETLSAVVTEKTGTTPAFILALGVILIWLVTGPLFHFSDTWQLVINTATTVVTFLMVFLIQRAQNKSAKAVALKLNEVIAAVEGASNRLIDIDQLSEAELDTLHRHFHELVRMAKRDSSLTKSHSVEEAETRHERKQGKRRVAS
ncbi:MAG TPA: low affinity iron permease family protein [Candidatus Limnocylindrales bacterium]|nr:low affinity iron permease family protein [Candidatus Limnocylindrales bacterium]